MYKYGNRCLVAAFSCLIIYNTSFAQDKVILLNGDTVAVKIPGHPRKETRLSRRTLGHVNDYGFDRVVVIFPPDSLRIMLPGQIKGYLRKEIGAHLGSGYFESRQVHMRYIGYRKLNKEKATFLQRVFTHKNFTIWYYREHMGDVHPETYYLIEQKGKSGYTTITMYKEWVSWANNYPEFNEITKSMPRPRHNNSALFNFLVQVGDAYKKQFP